MSESTILEKNMSEEEVRQILGEALRVVEAGQIITEKTHTHDGRTIRVNGIIGGHSINFQEDKTSWMENHSYKGSIDGLEVPGLDLIDFFRSAEEFMKKESEDED